MFFFAILHLSLQLVCQNLCEHGIDWCHLQIVLGLGKSLFWILDSSRNCGHRSLQRKKLQNVHYHESMKVKIVCIFTISTDNKYSDDTKKQTTKSVKKAFLCDKRLPTQLVEIIRILFDTKY